MLAKLRTELQITDQQHTTLRKMIDEGRDLAERHVLLKPPPSVNA